MNDEFKFIEKVKQKGYKQSSLVKGIGDDAAVFNEKQHSTVIATDTFVEDIHFSKKTMTFFHVGYRALAANLSDLAAMGAIPVYYLVSIVIPQTYKQDDLMEIYEGLTHLASHYQMDLIGGDTVSGDQFVLTVTVIGKTNEQKVRYRHTATEGDIVFVTGTLGDSLAGLYILKNNLTVKNGNYFIKRHQMPQPRINFSRLVGNIDRVTLNDVSDGIAGEAAEIAEASNKSIVLLEDDIPIHSDLCQFSKEKQNNWKYFGGEDFELFGTVAKKDWSELKECAKKANVKLTNIGYVTPRKKHLVYIEQDGKLRSLQKRGYTHLK